jgi:2-polyprenyl-6-methoxyphenol hydroxylase-like FAD-dependent oxidoreductase
VEFLPSLPRFAGARWALIGDAAHAMTPDLGQGGCQALEDAVELGAAVTDHDGLARALAAYDARRRPRAQAVAAASRRIGRLAQAGGPLAPLRDAAMHLTPARLRDGSVDRLLDWSPPRPHRAARAAADP